MPGIYSSSGFDLIGVLQRVATRPNPTVDLGPVDGSCTFLVVDARKFDFPIVYASESFEQLTGYSSKEILGRNCRFLQAPNGHVTLGSRRNYTSNDAAHQLKVGIMAGRDVQVSMVNYKKTGEAFMNMITLIPITWDTDDIVYYVGFQVDVVEQPNAIMRRMKNGTYAVNYSWMGMPSYGPAASYLGNDGLFHPSTSIPTPATPSSPSSSPSSSSIPTPATPSSSSSHFDPFPATADIYSLLNINHPSVIRNGEYVARMWYALLLASTSDFIHVLSLKGTFWYVGPGVTSLLGYEPHELIDTRLCHPQDCVLVKRELKEAKTDELISLLFRARKKDGSWVWVESQGRLHIEAGKGKKYLVMVARERPQPSLASDLVMAHTDPSSKNHPSARGRSTIDEEDVPCFWSKVSPQGLYLFVGRGCRRLLGREPDQLLGTSIYHYDRQDPGVPGLSIPSDRSPSITRALRRAMSGKVSHVIHTLQDKHDQYVDVSSTIFPDSIPSPSSSMLAGDSFMGGDFPTPTSGSPPSPSTLSESEDWFAPLSADRRTAWQVELSMARAENDRLRQQLHSLSKEKDEGENTPSYPESPSSTPSDTPRGRGGRGSERGKGVSDHPSPLPSSPDDYSRA
ncbi:MAG: PAS domain-containing protein [Piptocephalis tieghemiana]|nr:MAG: PAS domain-containing protein [Piptocephalis tieghemiana]